MCESEIQWAVSNEHVWSAVSIHRWSQSVSYASVRSLYFPVWCCTTALCVWSHSWQASRWVHRFVVVVSEAAAFLQSRQTALSWLAILPSRSAPQMFGWRDYPISTALLPSPLLHFYLLAYWLVNVFSWSSRHTASNVQSRVTDRLNRSLQFAYWFFSHVHTKVWILNKKRLL